MSTIYAGGIYAAAIAGIKTAARGYFTEQADGTYALDTQGLARWLQAQFAQMYADGEAQDAAYAASMAGQAQALASALAVAVNRGAFTSDPNWPVKTDIITSDAGRVAAVAQAQAALKTYVAEYSAVYTTLQAEATRLVSDYFNAKVIGNIPAATQRIVEGITYIYTYVTDRQEESEPSLASPVVERDQNDTSTLGCEPPPPGRFITRIRPYRSAAGNASADYLLIPHPSDEMGWPIDSLPVVGGKLQILDNVATADLQGPCPSFDWNEPKSDFRGAVSMGNGITVAYSGNDIYPSVAYRPFAYPQVWRKSSTHPIIGLCALDQLVVAGTTGPLKLIYGTDPSQLAEVRHNSGQTVASARSMVAMSAGFVAFASMEGVCIVDASGQVKNVTGEEGFGLFTREDWVSLNPSQIFAAEWEGHYIFHVPAGFCYVLNIQTGKLTTLTATGTAFYVDTYTDTLYMHTAGHELVAVAQGSGRRMAQWKSKDILQGRMTGYQWLKVESDFAAPVTVNLYRDGALWHTRSVTSNKALLLPAGKGFKWTQEVVSAARIDAVGMYESTAELQES